MIIPLTSIGDEKGPQHRKEEEEQKLQRFDNRSPVSPYVSNQRLAIVSVDDVEEAFEVFADDMPQHDKMNELL